MSQFVRIVFPVADIVIVLSVIEILLYFTFSSKGKSGNAYGRLIYKSLYRPSISNPLEKISNSSE